MVAVQVSVMAAEIRHVLALGRRQGAWDAVLCALVVIAAAACCAPVVTQPARFMVLFGVRSAAREHVMPKVQEDVKRNTTALNVPGRGGMNVVMERETSRQTMRRAGGQESVARAECAGCCVEHGDGGLKCATNTVALGCLAPGVINGSVPLYYADSVRFTKCVWDEMDRRGKCVVGRRRDVNFVAREWDAEAQHEMGQPRSLNAAGIEEEIAGEEAQDLDQADMFTGGADSEILQDEEEVAAIHCETTEGEEEAAGGGEDEL